MSPYRDARYDRPRRGHPAVLLCVGAWLLAGCNPAPVNVAARALTPITAGAIERVAVLPFTAAERGTAPRQAGQEPLSEPPAETVHRAVSTAMRALPDWQIVDDLVVGEALRELVGDVRPVTPREGQAVGRLLRADAVVRGQVVAFDERIGASYAAKEPAHVEFAVEVIAVPSGTTLWQAEYAESQQALSENLWNLGGFVRAGGKWLRARELAAIGAEQVAARMHAALHGTTATPVPATGGARRPVAQGPGPRKAGAVRAPSR